MIRAHDLIQNFRTQKSRLQIFTDANVINSPALVVGACIGAKAPPGVVVRLFIEMPESINVIVTQKFRHPFTLFGQEAGTFCISYRIMNVNSLMRNIVITAQKQIGALLAQFLHII